MILNSLYTDNTPCLQLSPPLLPREKMLNYCLQFLFGRLQHPGEILKQLAAQKIRGK